MADYNELEIAIRRHDADSYAVELRFNDPDSATSNPPKGGLARFDIPKLKDEEIRPNIYGSLLSQSLFSDQSLLTAFNIASALTLNQEKKLCLRLSIDQSAPELHNLRWETLGDPRGNESWLLIDQRILFSRYLQSTDWRPVAWRPKGQLRALVVIANPTNLADYASGRRASVDVAGELRRAKEGLGSMVKRSLVSDPSSPGLVTLDRLIETLREGFDILYLVCHGALAYQHNVQVPSLWLETPDGTSSVESGLVLVDLLSKLPTQPRLIVLASCQSAGQGDSSPGQRMVSIGSLQSDLSKAEGNSVDTSEPEGALAALGPRLAEAGIPAVLAMQGNVSTKTVELFMPAFFAQLRDEGQIDLAMAVARGRARAQPDAWMPVLFSRLRTGRFWYEGGFRTNNGGEAYDKWDILLRRIRKGKCTPILGYGLLESVLGSTREIARSWAHSDGFPMQRHAQDDLPQVAQYLRSKGDAEYPFEKLEEYLIRRLQERYGSEIPIELQQPDEELDQSQPGELLNQMLKHVVGLEAKRNPDEPHRILAKLPFKVYITTNPDNLLENALLDAGKARHVELCPWYLDTAPPKYDDIPSVQEPLVFHLFGQFHKPHSLVLTEDNYFDYLIGVTRNTNLIPEVVLGTQTRTQLLFLGFKMDDWNFRVLLKSLQRPGQKAAEEYENVAVQIDPDEDRFLNPLRARQYIEKYFRGDPNKIGIYWGSAEDFLKELRSKWNELSGVIPI